ncbi:hypothetical protein [uncultured Mediterranean phage]|nr:hypothetical protein [uncultured Mediterranean phage]
MLAEPTSDLTDQRHIYTWDDLKIAVTLDRFQEEKNGLKSEITIRDLKTGQKLIPTSNFNLSSAVGRTQMCNRLIARTPDESIPFELILDEVTDRSQTRWRTGDQVLDLFSIPTAERPRFLLRPYIESDGVTLLYGDGGSMKSLLALAMGLSVASGVPLLGMQPTMACPVLYLDWEASPEDHAERAKSLWKGADTTLDPPATLVHYQRQVASLHEGAPNAARVIQDLRAGLVIVDSIGMARGGAPEAADMTIQFFRAARSLGVPVLAIDHISQEARKTGDLSSPFGSRFTHNLSRRSWAVEKEQEEGDTEATLFTTNYKHNNGNRAEKLAFHIAFHNSGTSIRDEHLDRVVIQPQEYADAVADRGSLGRMTKKQQVTYALKAQGPMSVTAIRECLIEEGSAISEQVVRNTLNNNPQTFVAEPTGASGRKLWCLQGLADDAT